MERSKMKIISWNVAGLRAMIKKGNLQKMLDLYAPDVVCLQETKAEEHQVTLPEELSNKYPYRFWQSTHGTTQRKGLSGTTIWSKMKPERQYNPPVTDEEGRITTIEFDDYIIVSVYTPNSQGPDTPRLEFRTKVWHESFIFDHIVVRTKNPQTDNYLWRLVMLCTQRDMDIHWKALLVVLHNVPQLLILVDIRDPGV